MNAIEDHYDRMASETQRPCYSVTFWRTIGGGWGARAGLGHTVFRAELDAVIGAAVDDAISEQAKRTAHT